MTEQQDQLRAWFDQVSRTHDTWRERHQTYYGEQTALLQRLIPPGLRVLEVGCATGNTLAALQPSHGVGLDVSPRMLDIARARHPHLRFVEGNAETLDLGGETFDVVLLADLVGELHDVWAAFRALRNVSHDRTRIIITYYNFLWQPAVELGQALNVKRPQRLQNWLGERDLQGLLHLNGYQCVTQGSRLLLPLALGPVTPVVNRLSGLPGVRELDLIRYFVARPGPGFQTPAAPLTTSVIIPAKNERGNIRAAIRRTPRMGPSTEIIFVEGGSQDGTRQEILDAMRTEPTECTLRFVPQSGKGKGDAVRAGFAAATGDVLMILDADLTVAPEDLPRFYVALAENRGEFVNGSRLVYQMEDQAMRLLNLAANHFFGVAFSKVLGQPLKDTLCGTKVLRRTDYLRIAAGRDVFGDFDPFGDFDLLFGAARLGLHIVEIPVRYAARTYGETQISRFRHGLMLFGMLGRGVRHFSLGK